MAGRIFWLSYVLFRPKRVADRSGYSGRTSLQSLDIKEYPEGVDIVLFEGAIANEDNLELIKKVRYAYFVGGCFLNSEQLS